MKLESLIDTSKADSTNPMSKEDAECFMKMSMLDMKKPDLAETFKEEWPIGMKIMWKRLEWAGIGDKVSFPVKLFLCTLCNSPGKVVMWCYTLKHILVDRGVPKVTMGVLAEAFPMGFPIEEAYEACWVAQKGNSRNLKADNLMDNLEWWE